MATLTEADRALLAFGIFLDACRSLVRGRVEVLYVVPAVYERLRTHNFEGVNGLGWEHGTAVWRNILLRPSRRLHEPTMAWLMEYEFDIAGQPLWYCAQGGHLSPIAAWTDEALWGPGVADAPERPAPARPPERYIRLPGAPIQAIEE